MIIDFDTESLNKPYGYNEPIESYLEENMVIQ